MCCDLFLFFLDVFFKKNSINCNANLISQKLRIWAIVLDLIDDKVDATWSIIFYFLMLWIKTYMKWGYVHLVRLEIYIYYLKYTIILLKINIFKSTNYLTSSGVSHETLSIWIWNLLWSLTWKQWNKIDPNISLETK